MIYAWCIGFGGAPLGVVAPCSELLAPNGPCADALECAGCPFCSQIDVNGKIGSWRGTGLLQIALNCPTGTVDETTNPHAKIYFLYRKLGRVIIF